MGIDLTPTAHAAHMLHLAKLDGRDGLEQQASEEIIDAILSGKSLDCGGYEIDKEDFACVVSERHDFAAMLHGLVTGDLTPGFFHAYAVGCLTDYANRHATDRADAIEQREQDAAEYYGSDR